MLEITLIAICIVLIVQAVEINVIQKNIKQMQEDNERGGNIRKVILEQVDSISEKLGAV